MSIEGRFGERIEIAIFNYKVGEAFDANFMAINGQGILKSGHQRALHLAQQFRFNDFSKIL